MLYTLLPFSLDTGAWQDRVNKSPDFWSENLKRRSWRKKSLGTSSQQVVYKLLDSFTSCVYVELTLNSIYRVQ